jgi:response regulator of citrate/malate metabolism
MILLTAASHFETMKEATNLGGTEYVLKSFAPECLMKPVHQCCRGQMGHQGPERGSA